MEVPPISHSNTSAVDLDAEVAAGHGARSRVYEGGSGRHERCGSNDGSQKPATVPACPLPDRRLTIMNRWLGPYGADLPSKVPVVCRQDSEAAASTGSHWQNSRIMMRARQEHVPVPLRHQSR